MIVTTPFFHGYYRASLVDNDPTFGKGGLLWASLTLALLTAPVVIVATEEALAAVPNSMREGSYACGASHWQTIWRIVLPRAMPGIMTGMILAMARGAGEVAPLMLVSVKKAARELPPRHGFSVPSSRPQFHASGLHDLRCWISISRQRSGQADRLYYNLALDRDRRFAQPGSDLAAEASAAKIHVRPILTFVNSGVWTNLSGLDGETMPMTITPKNVPDPFGRKHTTRLK